MGQIPPKAPPSPQPQDVKALSALRDQLGDYLAAVERNTDAVNTWLSANKERIVLFYQRLSRALANKDEARAVALLAEMGDAAGFILSLQDFRGKAEAAFGKDGAFQKAAAAIADGLPENLQEPLPLSGSEEVPLNLAELEDLPLIPENPDKWYSSVSGWFNKEEREQEERERTYRRQLRDVKTEILGLQSDRHYYIDSFMDWIADTMAPETFDENGKAADTGAKMLQYRSPAYIIALAHADYQEAVETRARALRDAALEYAQVAETIDRQDVPGILKTITQNVYLFPLPPTTNSELLKKILLEDYKSLSLSELVLKHIRDRKSQAALLKKTFDIDADRMAFSDAQTVEAVFEKFCRLVLDESDPLDPSTLEKAIHSLKTDREIDESSIIFSSTLNKKTIFQRIAERFDNDLFAQKAALGALLHRRGVSTGYGLADTYVTLSSNLRHQKDVPAITKILEEIKTKKIALEVISLMQLCQPGASPLEQICAVSPDPQVKSALLEQGVQAGVLGELCMDDVSHKAAGKFKNLFEKDILPALDQFSVTAARTLIAHSFSTGGLEELRKMLTRSPDGWSGGWLEKVVTGKINDKKKAEWVAALLEPFQSDVIRANILNEAAAQPALPDAVTEALASLEKNLVGENIRLTPDKMLCNLPQIANIWYNAEGKMLRYIAQNQDHTLLENISPPQAEELLSLIQRRGGFMEERGALFNPEKIDAIHYGRDAVTMSLYRREGPLNIDDETVEQLRARTDFLHAADPRTGEVSSYNLAGICLLQKQDDGTSFLIDKYGAAHVVRVLPNQAPALLALGPSALFNPDNASIIRLNPGNNTFDFRVEGADFEKLLEHGADEFFYTVDTGDAKALSLLKKALDKAPDIHAPKTAAFSNLHFNMRALGYLSLDDKSSGFFCKRYSPTHKPGFIQVDATAAREILDGIEKENGVIRAGNLLAHVDSIDTAGYNTKEGKLQFVIGREFHEVYAAPQDGIAALLELTQKKSFYPVSVAPTEVVNLDRVTLLSHGNAQGKTHVVTKDLPIPLNLDKQGAETLFDKIEKQGLEAARQETASLSWTQGLGAAISALPLRLIRVSPFVDMGTPQILLAQALGQAKAKNGTPAKKLKETFATVASLPPAYGSYPYPENRALSSKKPSAPKSPKL